VSNADVHSKASYVDGGPQRVALICCRGSWDPKQKGGADAALPLPRPTITCFASEIAIQAFVECARVQLKQMVVTVVEIDRPTLGRDA
jgi:hypothetical protein